MQNKHKSIVEYASMARLEGSTVMVVRQERSNINNYVTMKLRRTHSLNAQRAT
jgi:hypothetical protein